MICSEATKCHVRGPVEHSVVVWMSQSIRPVLFGLNIFNDLLFHEVVPLYSRLALEEPWLQLITFRAFAHCWRTSRSSGLWCCFYLLLLHLNFWILIWVIMYFMSSMILLWIAFLLGWEFNLLHPILLCWTVRGFICNLLSRFCLKDRVSIDWGIML
jgi:hypothetical protein